MNVGVSQQQRYSRFRMSEPLVQNPMKNTHQISFEYHHDTAQFQEQLRHHGCLTSDTNVLIIVNNKLLLVEVFQNDKL